jgi:FkbM family methyltransferase
MIKPSIIWRTLTITRNPLAILSLKRGNTRKSVTFRNGLTFCLTWPQFRSLRDSYRFFAKCSVTQLGDDLFRLQDERSKAVCVSNLVPLFCELMTDFEIRQEGEVFHLRNAKLELVGSLAMLVCIQELRTEEYNCECKGKVILDVGGFEGESAAYFWSKGAKKVIIYEPVSKHLEFIEKNVMLNKVDAEIHATGIGDENGTQIIRYEETDPGFGLYSEGKKRAEIKVTAASNVIAESGADIAKFDCEGAEECLTRVPVETLQKIPLYIIEAHSPDIKVALIEKFLNAGFILQKEIAKPKPCKFSVLFFKKNTR